MVAQPNRSEGGDPPGTAYFIPARAGAWLVWCSSWGRLGDSGLSPRRRAAAPPLARRGRCFSRFVFGGGDHTDAFS